VTNLLFVRPADDSAAIHVAAWGQAVRQLATRFQVVDLCGTQVTKLTVDTELPTASAVLYFGHGTEIDLIAGGSPLLGIANLHLLTGVPVIAIACYAACALGTLAAAGDPHMTAFLGFDDEVGFPLRWPLPMGMAVVNGLRCLFASGHDLNCAARRLREEFEAARIDYKANGPSYGLSPSDTRYAWLFAKSNRYSVKVFGDGASVL
jgi:hypothetical protein